MSCEKFKALLQSVDGRAIGVTRAEMRGLKIIKKQKAKEKHVTVCALEFWLVSWQAWPNFGLNLFRKSGQGLMQDICHHRKHFMRERNADVRLYWIPGR